MAFAIIAGVTYQVQVQGTTGNAPERIGQVRRAFDGTARRSVRGEKESFSLLLAPISPAAYATLRNNTALAVPVTCSGDFQGGASGSFYVNITSAGYFKPNQTDGIFRVVALDLVQV